MKFFFVQNLIPYKKIIFQRFEISKGLFVEVLILRSAEKSTFPQDFAFSYGFIEFRIADGIVINSSNFNLTLLA